MLFWSSIFKVILYKLEICVLLKVCYFRQVGVLCNGPVVFREVVTFESSSLFYWMIHTD